MEMTEVETPAPPPAPRQTQFAELYMSKLMARLKDSNKTPQEAADELQSALAKLHELQKEFVTKQAKQNLLDKLAHLETMEDLQRAASARKAQVDVGYEQEKRELQTAVQEREDALRLLERLAAEVEQEKRNVVEHDKTKPAFETELERLTATWKAMQKRNAQRKAAIQVSTGLLINDEEDCARVLDQQTHKIQDLHEKQKELEDKKIDISTKVKRTKRTIQTLSKQNDMRSKDSEVKKREQDYMTLQQMQHWYDRVRNIQESLSGLEITQIADDFLEVRALKAHAVRLFCDPETTRLLRVEFLEPQVAANDLVEVAVRDNNVQYLLCEYRERVRQYLASVQ
ncbi:hypothetical protein BBJ29_001542 [Phytophthora kernoviae]|uniref:Kinetochore protein SPC25 n=1 Tax=Phytophthora kernoviae TaxID=325452 RepID=A0A3F2RXI7_9STRA|nr:hypothetical protein BBJ29_001542 [Phytophthora kernoviae]RLN66202.1 hypothetical protein BBP00_00002354 [Phytophthora kernoviae]